jgi:hypothetical protein
MEALEQFIKNFIWGSFVMLGWDRLNHIMNDYWLSFAIVNVFCFFAGRYWIFREEGVKSPIKAREDEEGGIENGTKRIN